MTVKSPKGAFACTRLAPNHNGTQTPIVRYTKEDDNET